MYKDELYTYTEILFFILPLLFRWTSNEQERVKKVGDREMDSLSIFVHEGYYYKSKDSHIERIRILEE